MSSPEPADAAATRPAGLREYVDEMGPTWVAGAIAAGPATISALVAIVRTDFDRLGSKFWWSALVIAGPVLGALVWLLFGRPPRDSRSRT